ncbi:MAG: hypothetical protein ACRCS6_04960 [Turicibacter sp.]
MGKNELGSPMNAVKGPVKGKVDVEFGTGSGDLQKKVKKATHQASQNTQSQQLKREKDMHRQL